IRAGVPRNFSKEYALCRGVGLHIRYFSKTSSGILIHLSELTSCSIRFIGNTGASMSGVIGCPVPGLSGGGRGFGRSAINFLPCFGIFFSGGTFFFFFLSPPP